MLAVVHRARIRPLRGGPLAQQSPRTVFANMKPPSKQEAPIVRGDGANKNDEFHGRTKKCRMAEVGAPQCTLPDLLARGWVRLAFGPAGPA